MRTGNLLKNGDFEDGPYVAPDNPWGLLVPPMDEDDVSPLPGWKIMSYKKVVKYVDAAHFAVPRGARAVELVSGGMYGPSSKSPFATRFSVQEASVVKFHGSHRQ